MDALPQNRPAANLVKHMFLKIFNVVKAIVKIVVVVARIISTLADQFEANSQYA